MYFQYEKDGVNVVILTMDQPGKSANLMGSEFQDAFLEVLGRLEAEKGLSGVILTSAKKTFMAGGDLDSLYALKDAAKAFEISEALKAGFRRLERLGKPVVAAINGAALGGGYELALACHRRIAVKDPKVQIGLPEVTLGLLPGGGGVTRLPRLLGIQAALPLLLEGTKLRPQEALQAGVVDELAEDSSDLIAKARAWIAANPEASQPWDRKGFKIPGGDPRTPKVAEVLTVAPAMLTKKTRGNYPAPQAILNAVVEGSWVDFETACRIESRYFATLVAGQVSKNMISAFWYQLNSIEGGGSRPKGVAPHRTQRVGILGAGMMGAAIAYSAAICGMEVVLKDVSIERAEKGKSYSENLLTKRVGKGRMTEEQKNVVLGRILPTDAAADLKGCDLVIEAVFEDRELKAKVTKETEDVIDAGAIYASNTSTLPITGLAQASCRAKNFIGLHFFSPVDKMPLVEIIVGKETSEETLARSFDFVKQIKKTPIVVNDSRGFYTSRVFGTYVMEGIAMLSEGMHARAIESAGLQAGMPVGPLALTDEVSLSLLLHIRRQTVKDLNAEGLSAPDHPAYAAVEIMVEKHGRPGKAAKKGFYEYPEDGAKYLWPELKSLFGREGKELPQQEMIERLLFVQVLDAVRCYEEGVVRTVADANIGSIFGWGFPAFKGGVLQYVNDCGAAAFVAKADQLAQKYGDRFAVPPGLRKMAAANSLFV